MKVDDNYIRALERAIDEEVFPIYIPDQNGFEYYSKSSGSKYWIKDDHCTCTGFSRWGLCKHVAMADYILWRMGKLIICDICGEMVHLSKARPVIDEPPILFVGVSQ